MPPEVAVLRNEERQPNMQHLNVTKGKHPNKGVSISPVKIQKVEMFSFLPLSYPEGHRRLKEG